MATILSSKNNLRLERSNQKVSWIEGHWHMRIRTIPALIFSFLVYYDSTTSFHHLEAIRRTHENLYDGLCCVLVLTFLPFCKIEWRLHDNSICLCESGKSVSCRTWKWKSKIHRKFQLFIIHLVDVNFEDYEQCFGAISSEIYLWMFPNFTFKSCVQNIQLTWWSASKCFDAVYVSYELNFSLSELCMPIVHGGVM